MATISKYFQDRLSEFPGRITLTDVEFGNQNTYDVDRAEGFITRDGTPFNAETFNRIADEMLDIGQKSADLIGAGLSKSLTASSSYFTGTIKYDKIGDMVIVYVDVVTTALISGGTTRGLSASAIESEMRPLTQASGLIRDMDDPLLHVTTSGLVCVNPNILSIPTGSAIKGEVVYFVS